MRLPSLLSFVVVSSVALASLGTAACSIKVGQPTEGDKGTLSFRYQAIDECLLGCGLDRSALQGSLVTVTAKGGDPNVKQTARIAEPSIATVSKQSPSCTSGEPKSCTLDIDIETHAEGDAHLEIVDPKGVLIDRVTVHVRAAARLEVRVNGAGFDAAQPTTVHVGDKVTIETHAFDATGGEELFTMHGISHDYGDKTILGPDSSNILGGSSNTEDMIAIAPGDTTVKVHAPGAEQVVRFHVVKP